MHRRTALALALSSVVPLSATASSPTELARSAATEWLGLVDASELNGSWERAASMFKRAVTAQQWVQAADSVRRPLGSVKSRREKGIQETKSLPGAPDGHYVLVQFDTAFENKSAGVETVTLALDADGSWRVAGYFIR